jgi:hypothetical protein
MVYGGVIEEALRNTVFGVFGAQYGLFKDQQKVNITENGI